MAFNKEYFARGSVALNTGMVIADGSQPASPTLFTYRSSTDTVATIAGANYFADAVWSLSVNDLIYCSGSDAVTMLVVATIDRAAGTIATVSASLTGAVNTANIVDLAVTTGKLADAAVTSAKVDETLIQHLQVDVALADFIGAYTASVELIPAPGANKKIVLHRSTLWINYGGTVLANGGAVHLQYDSTANGAGTKATGTLAAATLIAATADTSFGFTPVDTTLVDSTTLNKGLYFAAASADFTGGTSSAYKFDVWYSIMDVA